MWILRRCILGEWNSIKDLLLISHSSYILVEALKLNFKTAANPSFSCWFTYRADLFLWPPGRVCVPQADLFHLNGQMVGLCLVWYTIMPLCGQSRHFDWYYCGSHVFVCLFFVSTHPPTLLQRLGVTSTAAWTVTELYCSWFCERLVWGRWKTLRLGKVKGFPFSKSIHNSSTQGKDGNIKCTQYLLGKCKNTTKTISSKHYLIWEWN